MPGLVGVAGPLAREGKALAERMLALLQHQPSYRRDPAFEDGLAVASRNHVGILDPTPQPASAADAHVWLDGEIYGRDAWRERLGLPREASDAGIFLTLLQKDPGLGWLRDLDGLFAAAVWQPAQRRLLLVSDRFGLRPLFWTLHGGSLAWCSEAKGMLALPGFTPRLDAQALVEFLGQGYFSDARTWDEAVTLLPPATVISWRVGEAAPEARAYWTWDEVREMEGPLDLDAIAAELGRRFAASVRTRALAGGRPGLTLSGGLDSRAILAAMPPQDPPVETLTFGKPWSDDVRIARRASDIRAAKHNFYGISEENWLAPRLEGVWWTDGHFTLMHMHSLVAAPTMRRHFEVNLNGFLGDALVGGSFLVGPGGTPWERFLSRGRRFVNEGTRLLNVFIENRFPFFDKDLMDLTLSVPPEHRRHSRLYIRMLLRDHPDLFRRVPWQKTGLPISWPEPLHRGGAYARKGMGAVRNRLRRVGVRLPDRIRYTDYPDWIRAQPARAFFEALLSDPHARILEHVPRARIMDDLSAHIAGANRAPILCRYLTVELWLRQVEDPQWRSASGSAPARLLDTR